jgi:hypothetical protein
MITTINEFKSSINENKLTRNMNFTILGKTYTINNIEGNILHVTDNQGNKKMYNSRVLIEDGIEFIKPKRTVTPRAPRLSEKQFDELIKTLHIEEDEDDENYEGPDHSMIYDMAESMLSGNDALKNYLIKLYKDDYYNNDSEPSERK